MPSVSTESLLVDSNLLVYAVAAVEDDKSFQASQLLDRIAPTQRGTLTSQVITEFFSASTRRRRNKPAMLTTQEASEWVIRWLTSFQLSAITGAVVREACRGVVRHQMNIFDAQIWAAAKVHGIPIILTEDLQSSAIIEGVEYMNPLAPDFDIAYLGL